MKTKQQIKQKIQLIKESQDNCESDDRMYAEYEIMKETLEWILK